MSWREGNSAKQAEESSTWAEEAAPPPPTIVDVWYNNFFSELEKIEELLPQYPYIAMDTEFPGVVNVPKQITSDYVYKMVKINCDELLLIQLGITLYNDQGEMPEGTKSWQFNFTFDLDSEKSNIQSIAVLKEAGIDFAKHKTDGIPQAKFAEYIMASGLVL